MAYVGALAPNLVNWAPVVGLPGSGGLGSDPNLSSAAGQDGRASKLEALLP